MESWLAGELTPILTGTLAKALLPSDEFVFAAAVSGTWLYRISCCLLG